jgi:DNA-binding NarL/FixJ family response regulator
MPLLNGIKVASKLHGIGCRAKIIFVTVHRAGDFVDAAFSLGAQAYVLKPYTAGDLIPAIREVMRGNKFVSSFDRVDHIQKAHL